MLEVRKSHHYNKCSQGLGGIFIKEIPSKVAHYYHEVCKNHFGESGLRAFEPYRYFLMETDGILKPLVKSLTA
jgi:hypothetical protein